MKTKNFVTENRSQEIINFAKAGDFCIKYWMFQFWIFIFTYNFLVFMTGKAFIFGINPERQIESLLGSNLLTIASIFLTNFLFELFGLFKSFNAYKKADISYIKEQKNFNTINILRKSKNCLIGIMITGFFVGAMSAGIGGILFWASNLVCKYLFWSNLKKIKLLYYIF